MGDGTRYDESWFNFERLHRKMRQAEDEYDYHRRSALEDALSLKENCAEDIRRFFSEMQERVTMRDVCIERKEVLVRNYMTFITTAQEACRAVVQLYRDENRKARKSDAPQYFQVLHDCHLGHPPTEDHDKQKQDLAEQRQLLKSAEESRLTVLEELDKAYEDAIRSFVKSTDRAVDVGREEVLAS